jgi:hypothetical protein
MNVTRRVDSRTLTGSGEAVLSEATLTRVQDASDAASRERMPPIVPMLRAGGWSSATGRVAGRGR